MLHFLDFVINIVVESDTWKLLYLSINDFIGQLTKVFDLSHPWIIKVA